jgi:hypothetical protein
LDEGYKVAATEGLRQGFLVVDEATCGNDGVGFRFHARRTGPIIFQFVSSMDNAPKYIVGPDQQLIQFNLLRAAGFIWSADRRGS